MFFNTISFNSNIWFQDSASSFADVFILLHNAIFFYLICILFFVWFLIIKILVLFVWNPRKQTKKLSSNEKYHNSFWYFILINKNRIYTWFLFRLLNFFNKFWGFMNPIFFKLVNIIIFNFSVYFLEMFLFLGDYFFFFDYFCLCSNFCILLFFGLYVINYLNYKSVYFVKLMAFFCILLWLFEFFFVKDLIGIDVILFNGFFYFNSLSIFFKLFLTFLLIIFFFLSLDYYVKDKIFIFEYPLLFVFIFFGFSCLLGVYDFFLLYLALELQNLCFYVLIGLKKYSSYSIEAGLKYFILGSFSSGVFLFGVSFLYGFLGSLNFLDVQYNLFVLNTCYLNMDLFFFVVLFIFLGLLFKLGAAPFHWWLPDVYEGSTLLTTFFFFLISKLALFYLLAQFYYVIFSSFMDFLFFILSFSAISSIIFGVIFSLYQFKIKRLLAYSTIAHTGFILAALSLGTIQGFESFVIYYILYVFVLINVFSILLHYRQQRSFLKLNYIYEIFYLIRSNRLLGAFFSISLFSMAGLPPFAGFIGKFFIFLSFVYSMNYVYIFFFFTMSIISFVYYMRVVKLLFYKKYNVYVFYTDMPSTVVYLFVFFSYISIFFLFFCDIGFLWFNFYNFLFFYF